MSVPGKWEAHQQLNAKISTVPTPKDETPKIKEVKSLPPVKPIEVPTPEEVAAPEIVVLEEATESPKRFVKRSKVQGDGDE